MTGHGHTNADGVRRCIFHYPLPLDRHSRFGGQLRPAEMMKALTEWGEVWLVAGDAAQRRQRMREVVRAIEEGVHFDFCYSESSTMPTSLTGSKHLPTHPFQDFAFLARLRRVGIPVGLFYRDIHWRFPMYGKELSRSRKIAAITMYKYDLLAYGRCLDVIFLPSLEMADYVNLPGNVRLAPLPPGHAVSIPPASAEPSPLSLFYVGGFGDIYHVDALLAAVAQRPGVHLTVCTRRDEWAAALPRVERYLGENIQIVHAQGQAELAPFFQACNIGVLAVEPQEYWKFAVPLKLYEYIGNGKPILSSVGTLAGDIVAADKLGWRVPYGVAPLTDALDRLASTPAMVRSATEQVMKVREANSWSGRVGQAARVLAEVDRRG